MTGNGLFFCSFLSSLLVYLLRRGLFFSIEPCLGGSRPLGGSSRRVVIARVVMVQFYNGGAHMDDNFVSYAYAVSSQTLSCVQDWEGGSGSDIGRLDTV